MACGNGWGRMQNPKGRQGTSRKPHDRDEFRAHLESKIDEVCEGVKVGMTVNNACRAAGVNPTTYYVWRQKAKDGVEPYAGLYERIITAMAQGERTLAGRVFKASEDDWRAALAILERTHGKRWGRTMDVRAKVNHVISKMSDDELEREVKCLESKLGLGPSENSD